MELRQLRYLVAVADERHFTRAAARERIAQPALSRQIQNLEAELGVALVDRTPRRVELTDAGRRVVERARSILADADSIVADAQDRRGLLTGRLIIGVTPTPGSVDVAEKLAAFHVKHPALELVVREEISARLLEQVAADRIDLAITTAVASGIACSHLASDELVLMTHPSHPLGRSRRRVAFEVLRDEVFVSVPPGATLRHQLVAAARTAGFSPTIQFESSDLRRARDFVARNLAVALVPQSEVTPHSQDISIVRFTDLELRHEVHLARRERRQLSPAADAFGKALLASFEEL